MLIRNISYHILALRKFVLSLRLSNNISLFRLSVEVLLKSIFTLKANNQGTFQYFSLRPSNSPVYWCLTYLILTLSYKLIWSLVIFLQFRYWYLTQVIKKPPSTLISFSLMFYLKVWIFTVGCNRLTSNMSIFRNSVTLK